MAGRKPNVWKDRNRFADGFRILQGEQEYITYPEHSSIRIWPSEEEYRYERHNHSAVEIIWTRRGEVVVETLKQVYHIRKNQILMIPPRCSHSLSMEGDSSRLLFLFEPSVMMNLRDVSYLISAWNQPIFLREDNPATGKIALLLDKVSKTYQAKEPLWNTMCYSYLLQIGAALGNSEIAQRITESGNTSIDSELMDSAISFIKQNYTEKLMLDDVADFVGFSRFYFSRVFKQYTGMPFSLFLQKFRLDVAKEKLVFSEDSIQSIAFDCGFTSIATFNRLFQTHVQCTPTQYRLLYGEKAMREQGKGHYGEGKSS